MQVIFIGVGQQKVLADTGRVHDRGDRPDRGEQRRHRVPVGQVARVHRSIRKVARATTTGDQDQALGAVLGRPPGHLRAQPTGAARDQDRATRTPAGRAGRGGRGQAANQDSVSADRDLILGAERTGEHLGDPGPGPGVDRLGQVEQTAPELRVLQAGRAPEAPERGLADVDAGGGNRATGHEPDRDGPTDQRLDQIERLDQRGRGGDDAAGGVSQGDNRRAVSFQQISEAVVTDHCPGAGKNRRGRSRGRRSRS